MFTCNQPLCRRFNFVDDNVFDVIVVEEDDDDEDVVDDGVGGCGGGNGAVDDDVDSFRLVVTGTVGVVDGRIGEEEDEGE